jgi:hypothetical protein
LLEPRARLYIAEINGEPVGIGGLRPLAAHEARGLESAEADAWIADQLAATA